MNKIKKVEHYEVGGFLFDTKEQAEIWQRFLNLQDRAYKVEKRMGRDFTDGIFFDLSLLHSMLTVSFWPDWKQCINIVRGPVRKPTTPAKVLPRILKDVKKHEKTLDKVLRELNKEFK